MVQSFKTLARFHTPNGRGYRAGLENSAWTELNVTRLSDAGFLGFFRNKIDVALDRYNRGRRPRHPDPEFAEVRRPDPEALSTRAVTESFERHFDSINEVWQSLPRLLWYLNDVETGGETHFPQLEYERAAAGRAPAGVSALLDVPARRPAAGFRRQVHRLDLPAVLTGEFVTPALEVGLQFGRSPARGAARTGASGRPTANAPAARPAHSSAC